MRKYLLPVMALCLGLTTSAKAETTDLSSYSHVIYVESSSLSIGTSGYLSISMKNEDKSIEGFSFTLQLPEGITPNGTPTLSSNRSASKSFSFPTDPNVSGQDINFVASPKTESGLGVGDGEIILVPVTISADVSGNLTVVVKDIKMGYTDTENKQQYAFNDETVEIKTDIAMTSDVIINENWTQAPAKANGVNVTVYRSLNAGVWSTICLPFAMTGDQLTDAFGSDVALAEFTGYDETYDNDDNITSITVNFDDVVVANGIEANHPYIIKTSTDITDFSLTTQINPSEDDAYVQYDNGLSGKKQVIYGYFNGTLKVGTVPEKSLFLNGGKFYYSTGNTTIKAFRGYFELYDVLNNYASGVKFNIFVDGETTRIEGIQDDTEDVTYDLSGRKLVRPTHRGVYIQNGKKVLVK